MELVNKFTNLYKENRQIALLSAVYGAVAAVALLIAGLFAIVDQEIGRKILIVPEISMIVLIANLVVWSIIHTLFDSIDNAGKHKKSSK
jgi:hypothetical protein